jgi:hypothetical protein
LITIITFIKCKTRFLEKNRILEPEARYCALQPGFVMNPVANGAFKSRRTRSNAGEDRRLQWRETAGCGADLGRKWSKLVNRDKVKLHAKGPASYRKRTWHNIGILKHDPEKWEPVFGKDHAQTKT